MKSSQINCCISLDNPPAQRNRPAGGDGTGETNSTGERRIRSTLGESPAAAGTKTGRGLFALRRDPVSFSGKETGKRNRQRGPISRRSPLDSLPDDQGGSAPIGFPTFGRETKDEGRKTGVWTGDCGLPQPLRGFAMTGDERRKTKDGRRKTGDERRETKDEGRGFAMTGLGGDCVCPGFPVLAAFSAPFLAMT